MVGVPLRSATRRTGIARPRPTRSNLSSEATGRRRPAGPATRTGLALLAWAGLILVSHVLGARLVARDPRTVIFAAPLVARFDPHLPPTALIPVAIAAVVVLFAPRLVADLGWRRLLVVAFLGAAAWAVAVALADGAAELTRPLHFPNDYLADVRLIGSPGVFLSHFVSTIGRLHQHVRAHPPGMVLLLWAMNRAGLGGPGWEAALEILGGAAMVPAVLVAVREMAGERTARAAAPFVAFAPAAVWVATTGDAFFAGVEAWAVALLVLSLHRTGRRSAGLALAGGVTFGVALLLTYGVAVLAVIPALVAVARRRLVPILLAAVGVGAVVLASGIAGFWWFEGLRASLVQYRTGVARFRPQSYFWYGDLGAFAVVLGPATAVGLARLRDRGVWLLVGGGLLAMALSDASGLSKAEVERIWLPIAPWILAVGSSVVARPQADLASADATVALRTWLTLTLGAGLAIQLLLRTTW